MCARKLKKGICRLSIAGVVACVLLCNLLIAADIEVTKRSDGTEITFDRVKGIKTIRNADGTSSEVDLNGKTPYGTAITGTDRVFCKNDDFQASLLYDSSKSDDVLQDDILLFYDALYSALKGSYLKKTITSSFQVKVSYCRFCEHSYCYKKNQQVSVEIAGGKKQLPVYSFSALDLNDKAKRDENIMQIVTKVSSLAATL